MYYGPTESTLEQFIGIELWKIRPLGVPAAGVKTPGHLCGANDGSINMFRSAILVIGIFRLI
jgi:hypothetical protein